MERGERSLLNERTKFVPAPQNFYIGDGYGYSLCKSVCAPLCAVGLAQTKSCPILFHKKFLPGFFQEAAFPLRSPPYPTQLLRQSQTILRGELAKGAGGNQLVHCLVELRAEIGILAERHAVFLVRQLRCYH